MTSIQFQTDLNTYAQLKGYANEKQMPLSEAVAFLVKEVINKEEAQSKYSHFLAKGELTESLIKLYR